MGCKSEDKKEKQIGIYSNKIKLPIIQGFKLLKFDRDSDYKELCKFYKCIEASEKKIYYNQIDSIVIKICKPNKRIILEDDIKIKLIDEDYLLYKNYKVNDSILINEFIEIDRKMCYRKIFHRNFIKFNSSLDIEIISAKQLDVINSLEFVKKIEMHGTIQKEDLLN